MGLPASKSRLDKPLECDLLQVMRNGVNASELGTVTIARRAGLHRTTVQDLIHGKRPGAVETWDLILTAAGVQLGYRIQEPS